jgi:hypothetical protein
MIDEEDAIVCDVTPDGSDVVCKVMSDVDTKEYYARELSELTDNGIGYPPPIQTRAYMDVDEDMNFSEPVHYFEKTEQEQGCSCRRLTEKV